jgi:hypothetical protein
MAIREVDAISNAIIETEREIAGSAWDQEDTELDETGDRSNEEMGEGLEGQHEADDEVELEADDADGETETEAETAEAEAAAAAAAAANGKDKTAEKPAAEVAPEGRVPSAKYREVAERARAAETERDALKAQIEKSGGENKSLTERLDLVMREIADIKRIPRSEARPAEPPKPVEAPDIFENPTGFVEHITGQFQSELNKRDAALANQRVETSMAIAHASHKDTFEKAFAAINQLNPQNPDDRVTVQRIYSSPNPGEALVSWHKRSLTLAEVGDDPAAYRERVAKETREALMKDPEFRKQLIADLRGEAANPGPDGNPRTTVRLPGSLNRAPGSNLGAERNDSRAVGDDSEQAVANAAWR